MGERYGKDMVIFSDPLMGLNMANVENGLEIYLNIWLIVVYDGIW